MKRLFIGIPVECENALSQVRTWQTEPGLNSNRLVWTKYSNWHITLVFLGALPEASVTLLSQLIDNTFEYCRSYSTIIKGLGVFPEKRKPNVLWLGLENIHPLLPYYEKLTSLLVQNNFALDPKPFKAHLTIARVKSLNNPEPFYNLLQTNGNTFFGPVNIARVILYESVSSPHGVSYLPLHVKDLKKNTTE